VLRGVRGGAGGVLRAGHVLRLVGRFLGPAFETAEDERRLLLSAAGSSVGVRVC